MHIPVSPLLVLTLILSLFGIPITAKSTATSFCKCICFNNSTIIALNPPTSSTRAEHNNLLAVRSAAEDDDSSANPPVSSPRPHHKLTCADCTRAFCLDYNLPICKNAREEDVFTSCFQRDSLKDETVVVVFIFATAGLLAWALVKPWVDRLKERNTFMPLAKHDGNGPNFGTAAPQASRNASASASASRGGAGGSRGAGLGRGGIARSGPATRPDDEGLLADMHADQDAVDIVSGSGSR
ncbi:hypothetical protein LTR10_019325 [Elasticomyces elasticus]|uniref:Uncharacterized protein n=1 Tax=Exophiala sideris TaxID=1016849 RepID=A0A0D1YNL9_9EURO|nr:hypothetical protein LTR10_019325 [Elasticomyces elasticus]KAK5024326.1 hypothetical protein LTS07_008617 [Exophiala sideris]KAK5179585.1 hypothetical protein LTR44_008101 [Eurotiomycetes sp. CCFEE 6388]KAK5030992.1 hypothetical protein LTR13_008005 [Exophiala sideris]KAK5054059.1 hypothetical protein LTR69_009021 [Exophiala sideris]